MLKGSLIELAIQNRMPSFTKTREWLIEGFSRENETFFVSSFP
jgi:hypothetical protein